MDCGTFINVLWVIRSDTDQYHIYQPSQNKLSIVIFFNEIILKTVDIYVLGYFNFPKNFLIKRKIASEEIHYQLAS